MQAICEKLLHKCSLIPFGITCNASYNMQVNVLGISSTISVKNGSLLISKVQLFLNIEPPPLHTNTCITNAFVILQSVTCRVVNVFPVRHAPVLFRTSQSNPWQMYQLWCFDLKLVYFIFLHKLWYDSMKNIPWYTHFGMHLFINMRTI